MEMIPLFMEHKASELDPAWAWNRAIEKYQVPPASIRTVQRTNRFKRFMQDYFTRTKDTEAKSILYGKTTWLDVQQEATQAVEEYNRQGHDWKHPFRTAGRSFSDSASAVEFLLELLPMGEYTSIVCGALRLVYSAAKRMKEIREQILTSLNGLSQTIDDTKSYIRLYSQDVELQQKAENLYITILEAVEGMTTWLSHNPRTEPFKAFFQHNNYGKALQDKITTNIQSSATLFHERVQICLHSRILNIDTQNVELLKGMQKANSKLEDFLEGFAKDREWQIEQNKQLVKAANRMERMEKELQQISTDNNKGNPIIITQVIQQAVITPQELLRILAMDHQRSLGENTGDGWLISETVTRDTQLAIAFGKSMNNTRQARTASLMEEPKFQSWFKVARSDTLVINGMETHGIDDTISPLTYLCTLLSQMLTRMRIATPLTFLCGQHAVPGDPLEGAAGIMRSLISQILLSHGESLDLAFLGFAKIQAIMSHDTTTLCQLFEDLLARMGQGVVFCMIDGISWYETEARVEAMWIVMPFLQSLVEAVEASGSGCMFKLLITSPIISQYASSWFPPGAELLMQGKVERIGDGFGELQMMERSQDVLNIYQG